MSRHYKLVGHEAVPCTSEEFTWGDDKDRIVSQTEIGDVMISTVFLCIDHQHGDGPPLLFETMIFGGELDQYQARHSTWDEAELFHSVLVKLVESGLPLSARYEVIKKP